MCSIKRLNPSYDAVGNLLKKTDYSQNNNNAYQYASNSNRLNQVTLKSGSVKSFQYDNRGNLTRRNNVLEAEYNTLDKPTKIMRNGAVIDLYYDANWMRYKQVRTYQGQTTTTYYLGKGFEVEKKGTQTTEHSYISNIAILTEVNNSPTIRFTHKDRLGSTATFTDRYGNALGYRSYDPFGKPRMGNNSPMSRYAKAARLVNNINDTSNPIRRGFTDHEHLDEAELIHMNGRVYDYHLGRFMSVDPFIQEPGNSQGINPYSYVMNNPLGYTDPSGYTAEKVITVAKAGSRIRTKVTVSASSSNGTTDISVSGSSSSDVKAVMAAVGGAIQASGGKAVSDVGSQQNLAKTNLAGGGSGTAAPTKVASSTSGDNFLDNGEQHSPVFGDEAFYPNHETFHHYDTFTPICGEGTDGCTFDILNDDVLYHFSYPAMRLIATPAAIDGKPVVAYIVGPLDAMLGNTDNPLNYDVPVGRVIQIRTPDGGIQNQTLRDHGMYNGTITRKIISRDGNLGIWTHGIGVNMFISKVYPEVSPLVNPTIGYINKKLAQANDIHGPRAFAAMDAQAKQYWSNKYGN